ncbi:MAG: hypothetical protein U5K00_15715 [Melioribacteraceae bacterium]|nr:hypothetical protein [Melioribacteraceae bacterium]
MSLVKQIVSDSFIPLDVVIKDDFLLLIDGDEIEVYNIDNPSDPILLNKYLFTAEQISFPKIEIIENNGVIIGNKRIITFDLSQLPNINFSNSTDFTVDVPFNSSGFLIEPYSISNNTIYYSIGTYSDGSILNVIDIEDLTDPKIVGTYESSQRINGIMK